MVLRIQRSRNPYLWGCLGLAAFLCVAQVLANTALLLACLICFLAFAVYAAAKGFASPVLLFFLPWSPLLKLAPGTITFYTLAMAAACLICFFRKRFLINSYCVLFALPVVVVTLLAKAFDGSSLSTGYILFVCYLFLFPTMASELRERVDFKTLTVYFSLGIISSALSAQQLMGVSTIARYIDVYSWNVVTRLSGYYGDANFYSAHISAALSGVLLVYLREEKGSQRNLMMLLTVALLYCGFLSGSKSFILTAAAVFLIWFCRFLIMRGNLRRKLITLAGIVLLVGVVIASGLFEEQWEMMLFRFGQATDFSSLTTGRSEQWINYLRELAGDIKLLAFGRGFVNRLVNGIASHNTVIQIVYQFGVLGTVSLAAWALYYVRSVLKHNRGKASVLDTAVLLVGVFLPWMALDMVFFDEFFLMPMYVVSGLVYMGSGRNDGISYDSIS